MTDRAANAVLIAVTARADAAFPGVLFASLRKYDLDTVDPPSESVDVTSIGHALEIVERWLRALVD